MNIDEATARNTCRVLDILISFFDSDLGKVCVYHIKSVHLIKVNASTVTEKLLEALNEFDLDKSRLISILMDSCAVMRGSKSGVETRMKKHCPNLLDVDGDTCHHVNNAARKFTTALGGNAELLFFDLHTHFKYSSDQKDAYYQICQALQLPCHLPLAHCATRWLSSFECSCHFLELIDAYTVFFHTFLKEEDRKKNRHYLIDVFKRRKTSVEGQQFIEDIQEELRRKKFTKAGRQRLERIEGFLFEERRKLIVTMKLYRSVLSILRKYTLLFQREEPMIHMVYEELENIYREFLSFFVRPEVLMDKSAKSLCQLKLDESTVQLPLDSIFFGDARDGILTMQHMKQQLLSAYVSTAKYIQEKMPYNNLLLRHLSSLSPDLRTHTLGKQYLLHLALDYIDILDDAEKDEIEKEICDYCVNPASFDRSKRIDHYWYGLRKEYPLLSKLALVYIVIISAPEVERSFSRMASSLNEKTSQMNVETLDAIQSVKQYLLVHKQSSIQKFKRKDIVHDPVPSNLVKKMLNASAQRKESLNTQRERKSDFLRRLSMKQQKTVSRSLVRQIAIQVAEKARRKHRKQALKILAEKSRKKKLIIGKSSVIQDHENETVEKRNEEEQKQRKRGIEKRNEEEQKQWKRGIEKRNEEEQKKRRIEKRNEEDQEQKKRISENVKQSSITSFFK